MRRCCGAGSGCAARVIARLGQEFQPKLRTVINATGIVLHTNLGRAPIADEAAKAAYDAATQAYAKILEEAHEDRK